MKSREQKNDGGFPFPDTAAIGGRLGEELGKRVAPDRGNFWRMAAWNEKAALALMDLADALRGDERLPPEVREFVILRTARMCGAVVPCLLHRQSAIRSGVDSAIVAAALDEAELPPGSFLIDVMKVVDSVVADHCADPDALRRLEAAMGPAATLDVVQLTGFYLTVSTVLNSCGIDSEDKD